jgi:hypothetical protein
MSLQNEKTTNEEASELAVPKKQSMSVKTSELSDLLLIAVFARGGYHREAKRLLKTQHGDAHTIGRVLLGENIPLDASGAGLVAQLQRSSLRAKTNHTPGVK